jgi:hypothetical protein
MALLGNTGETPDGSSVSIPVTGSVFSTNVPLAAGASIIARPDSANDWFDTIKFSGIVVRYYASSDGGYTIEFSDDMDALSAPLVTVQYSKDEGLRQGGFTPRGRYCRIVFINGNQDQTFLSASVNLSADPIQPSLENLGAQSAKTRFAIVVKSDLQIQDETGSYGNVMRDDKALMVKVVNQEGMADVSALAKDATLTDGSAIVSVNNFPSTQAVHVDNFPAVPTTISVGNFPDIQKVQIQGGITVAGSVSISNFPNTQQVAGTIAVSNSDYSKDLTLTNGTQTTQVTNFPDTQKIVGAVTVSNFPATQAVAVSNFPATQNIAGTVTVSNPSAATDVSALAKTTDLTSGNARVQVTNFPATQPISGTVTIANPTGATDVSALAKDSTLTNGAQKAVVSGTINVGNLPATQPVSGSVNVGNFPATQVVTGTFWQATQPVSGSVAVINLPATQPISAATLPLPINAATENGNLLAIATATGTKADTAVTDSTAAASELALLKGLLYRLSNVLTVATNPTTTGGYPNKAIYQPSGTAGSFTLIATGVHKMGALNISNTSGQTISIVLYDKATAPVTADTPVQMFAVPNGQSMAVNLGDGLHFANGIGIGGIVGTNLGSLLGGLLTTAISAGTVAVSYAYV